MPANSGSWLRRWQDMPNDRPLKTVIVTLAVALVCNLLMRSVHPRHHISDDGAGEDIA